MYINKFDIMLVNQKTEIIYNREQYYQQIRENALHILANCHALLHFQYASNIMLWVFCRHLTLHWVFMQIKDKMKRITFKQILHNNTIN